MKEKAVLHAVIDADLKQALKIKAAQEKITMPEAAEAAIKMYTEDQDK